MNTEMSTTMRAWLRDHPWQADGLLAVVLLAFSGSQFAAGQASTAMHVTFIAVTVLLAATVVPRRRYPVVAFAAAAVTGAAQIAFGVGPGQAPVYALQPTNADLAILTPREREVLSLIAQGRSNAAIATTLFISPKVVEKHVANIFDKFGLAPDDNDNRRVIAALRYLES
jgi:Bacterial regulatory proteins, luxR family